MAELLKNSYDTELLNTISKAIKKQYAAFNASGFHIFCQRDDWKSLELKQRINRIAAGLNQYLPANYTRAIGILIRSVIDIPGGLKGLFLPAFVENYGTAHWEDSMRALATFTCHSTAELAIRPFIVEQPNKTMTKLIEWSLSNNEHHRRLASEGSRPRLPWASPLRSFIADPSPLWPILTTLKNDPSEYVRRSVANNLNDISKDHPEVVIRTAKAWWGQTEATNKLLKHGLRTLLKKPHPEALKIVGYGSAKDILVDQWRASPEEVSIGDPIQLHLLLNITEFSGKLRVEYLIDFVKANGSSSRKVFQLMARSTDHESQIQTTRKHSFKDLSTRKHYTGIHQIHLRINGELMATTEVTVIKKRSTHV